MTLLLSGHLKEQEEIAALRLLAHGAGTSHFQFPRPQLISWNRLLAERTCLIWLLINLHSPLPPSSWAWCCCNELKLVMNRNPFMWNSTSPWLLSGPSASTSAAHLTIRPMAVRNLKGYPASQVGLSGEVGRGIYQPPLNPSLMNSANMGGAWRLQRHRASCWPRREVGWQGPNLLHWDLRN